MAEEHYRLYLETGNSHYLDSAKQVITPDIVPPASEPRLVIGAKRREAPPTRRTFGEGASSSTSVPPPVAKYAHKGYSASAWMMGTRFRKRK